VQAVSGALDVTTGPFLRSPDQDGSPLTEIARRWCARRAAAEGLRKRILE
jgi:hypothetical protein